MNRAGIAGIVLSLVAGSWMVGCGGDSGGAAPASPSSSQLTQTQEAGAADSAANQATSAATDGVVADGTGGAASSKPNSSAPSFGFNFNSSVNVTVDLDALNAQGNDRYPNTTGLISVSATGTVTGTSQNGQASYSVQVTVLTDVVYTDPNSGDSGRIAPGASWTYTLSVSWSWTDSQNWTVSTSSDSQLSGLQVTVQSGALVVTASVSGTRQVSGLWTRAAGVPSFSYSWTGVKTITVTEGTTSHVIVIEVQSSTSIFITVDGVTFGPYTVAQVVAFFQMQMS